MSVHELDLLGAIPVLPNAVQLGKYVLLLQQPLQRGFRDSRANGTTLAVAAVAVRLLLEQDDFLLAIRSSVHTRNLCPLAHQVHVRGRVAARATRVSSACARPLKGRTYMCVWQSTRREREEAMMNEIELRGAASSEVKKSKRRMGEGRAGRGLGSRAREP